MLLLNVHFNVQITHPLGYQSTLFSLYQCISHWSRPMMPFFSGAQQMLSDKKKRDFDMYASLNVCVCVYKDWNNDSPDLVQVEPIPDDTHEESYGKHPTKLHKPRHLWPKLSGYGRRRN